jgi:succinate-acetate transporter protein
MTGSSQSVSIVCGLSAIYLAMAEVTNETYGRTVLPIFSMQK